MNKVVKVKKGTEAWDLLYKVYHHQDKWNECKEEIDAFLGFPNEGNVGCSVNSLYVKPECVKEEWKDQFKKNTNPAQAKTKSKINLQWIELCKKLELEVHELRTFQIKYGLYFTQFTVYNYPDDFYIEFEKAMDTSLNGLNQCLNLSF